MHMALPTSSPSSSSHSSSDSSADRSAPHTGHARSILHGVHFRKRSRSREVDRDDFAKAASCESSSSDGSEHAALVAPAPTYPTTTTTTTSAATTGDPTARTAGRADAASPPDGTALVAEWKEGRDLVIETRRGPGEDVDVVVIRGGAGGEPGEVEQRIHRLKQRLAGKTHGLLHN